MGLRECKEKGNLPEVSNFRKKTMKSSISKENRYFTRGVKNLLFMRIYAKIGEALSEERDETGGKGQA